MKELEMSRNYEDIFEITIDNGYFLKYLIDFLAACANSKCWMRFDQEGVKVQDNTEKQDNVKCFTVLNLFRSNFSHFSLKKTVSLQIDPKQIQKLCRNIKKKDRITLLFKELTDTEGLKLHKTYSDYYENQLQTPESSQLSLIISSSDVKKREVKNIPVHSYYEKEEFIPYVTPKNFKQFPYSISSLEIQSLKRAMGGGVKKEVVKISLCGEKYMQFDTLAHGISPLHITYGKCPEDEKTTQAKISGNVIIMLSKLSNLCKLLKFYEEDIKDENCDYTLINMSTNIDIPQYMGTIEFYIFSDKEQNES